MANRVKKVLHRVDGCWHTGRYSARNAAAAVKQFCREFHISRCKELRRDPETGGWSGLSVSIV
jgi:hypothetical protein